MTASLSALQSSPHSSAFSATKALQNRHKGNVQFALPPTAAAATPAGTPASAVPASASASGNLLSNQLLAQLQQQKK
jgi:hypothetical protein